MKKRPFQVGDWALHVNGLTDEREVVAVDENAGTITLDLWGEPIGPYPAKNYQNLGDLK